MAKLTSPVTNARAAASTAVQFDNRHSVPALNDFSDGLAVNLKGKNNGVIEIPYIGKDELVRILQLFGINFPQ